MAKPLRATPTLTGSDAIKFLEIMIKEENKPSKNRLETIHRAKRNSAYFGQFL